MRALPFLGLAASLLVALPADAAPCPRDGLTGQVTYVRDRDTIELGSMAIRFEGMATPERRDPGGHEATEAIEALVLGKEVRCELTGKRTYDRCVAVWYLNRADIEAMMVCNGFARDCRATAAGRHAEAERQAAAAGATIRGIYRLPGYCRSR